MSERRPRQRWKRNMYTAILLLAMLDSIIISGSLNMTRIAIAFAVTLTVALFVALIWRRNTKLEKETTNRQSRAS